MHGFLPFVAPSALTLYAVIFCWREITLWLRAEATRGWHPCAGRIVHSQIGIGPGQVDPAFDARASLWFVRRQTASYPDVRYRYTVGGHELESTQVTLRGYEGEAVHEVVARYPTGAAVNVWYKPDAPTEAVLEPGASADNFVGTAVSLLFLAGSLWWLWSGGIHPRR